MLCSKSASGDKIRRNFHRTAYAGFSTRLHTTLPSLARDKFRDSRRNRIAYEQMSARVHGHIIRLSKLAVPAPWAVADRSQHVAVPIDLEHLPVLTRRHPKLLARVDVERANEIPRLNRLDEFPSPVINHDAILLAIADINISVARIHGDRVRHTEVPRPGTVPEPLRNELAVLVQPKYARRTAHVCRRPIGVVGTLVGVPHRDVNVAIGRERHLQRLPQ